MLYVNGMGEFYIDNTGPASKEHISSNIIKISIPFSTSNRDHGALVFKGDCVTEFDSDSYFEVDTTTPESSSTDKFIQFYTILLMDIDALNGTEYWNPFIDGNRGGWVEVCTETYLTFIDTLNDEETKMNFKNNVFNISVSLTSNFAIDDVDIDGSGDFPESV